MFKTRKRVPTKEYFYLLQLKMQLIQNIRQEILLTTNTDFTVQGINYEDQVQRKNKTSFSVNHMQERQSRLAYNTQKAKSRNDIQFSDQISANRIKFSLKTETSTIQQMKLSSINRISKTEDRLHIKLKLPKLSTPQPQISQWSYSNSFSDLEI